jgi:CRISPR/Cas system-associated exonuclease Cas4 (RecB family)
MFNHCNIISPIDIPTIDKNGKRLYKIDNDRIYPSITTILGQKEKPGLADWRASLGASAANKEMKRASDRGTAVHLMTERYINNDPNPIKDQKIEHIVEFNSLKMLLRGIDNVITQESALYSDTLQITGRVDCVGDYKGKLCIIDFKTSTNDKSRNLIEDYFLQTTAYALMFEEQYDIVIEDVIILMSVEKEVPMIFKGKVDDYIVPLLNRINTYHSTN